jgi:tRNA A-37 threonylcarbamoyl transferase component Bud32
VKSGSTWRFASGLSDAEKIAFQGKEQTLALEGELINDSKTNFTQRVQIGDRFYFVKRYLIPGKHLRRYLAASRVNREWKNLSWFEKHQIPTPRRIVMGEGDRWQGQYWGVIVSEEVSQTIDLRKVYRDSPEMLRNRFWRLEIIKRLASVVAKLHETGFIHNDLQWRNILVSLPNDADCRVFLIDCPAGRPIYLRGNRRGVVRDLAFLDKMAKVALSKTDRLRFYMLYRRVKRLRERDKKEIRRVLGFLS